MIELFELVMEIADAPAAGGHLVEHRASGHLLDVLPEIADAHLLRDRNLPFVGHFFARDHPEDGRLAGAVRTDEADLFTRIELERGVDEEDLSAVCLLMCVSEIMRAFRVYS